MIRGVSIFSGTRALARQRSTIAKQIWYPIDPRNFGCDVSVRTPVQILGEGEGSPKTTRRVVENAIFSWREIAWCFWADSVFLGGNSSVGPWTA